MNSAPAGPAQSRAFQRATDELRAFAWRPEVAVEEIPSPQRIAPYAAAIEADVMSMDEIIGNGRLILLHDPLGNDAWQGTFRCVTFAKADVDLEMVTDPFLADVGWSWLTDALESHHATFVAPSGTVTAVSSRSFGGMATEPERAEVEIRASWTPVLDGPTSFVAHVAAWQDLICLTAGMPPLPEGVVSMVSRVGRNR